MAAIVALSAAARAVAMKELQLSGAAHEVCFERSTDAVFVSQMSDSVLVRLKLGADGMVDEANHKAWRVGEVLDGYGISGLHNVSLSDAYPGHLWISLQFANQVLLLDVRHLDASGAVPRVVKRLQVPTGADDATVLQRLEESSSTQRPAVFGGPHVVRESPASGDLWVGLKGHVSCCPSSLDDEVTDDDDSESSSSSGDSGVLAAASASKRRRSDQGTSQGGVSDTRRQRRRTSTPSSNSSLAMIPPKSNAALLKALGRACCSVAAGRRLFREHRKRGYRTPQPNSFGVWHLKIEAWRPNGDETTETTPQSVQGRLYECLKSPPMLDVDRNDNCWVAQDASPVVFFVDETTQKGSTVQIPYPSSVNGRADRATGPGCVVNPADGDVWFSLLGADNSMLRFRPSTGQLCPLELPGTLTYYDFGPLPWAPALNTVHHAFATVADRNLLRNLLLVVTSDLVDHASVNALEVLEFDADYARVVSRRVVPLPTQDSAVHRVAVAHADALDKASAVVTELNSAKLFQIKLQHLLDNAEPLNEVSDMVQRTAPPDSLQNLNEFHSFAYTSKSYFHKAPGASVGGHAGLEP